MKVLESCDNPQVKYHSSIAQHDNTLCVLIRGEWCPISFDSLDYIDCERIESHRAIVTDGDDIGYHFNVAECKLYTNEYVYYDEYGSILKKLPEWFGAGFYMEALTSQAFLNSDTNSLGVRNLIRLRKGLNYALADTTLPAVE